VRDWRANSWWTTSCHGPEAAWLERRKIHEQYANGESRWAGRTAIRVLGAEHVDEIEQVRQFFRNYAGWLGVDLCFQNFDEEMANLPGRYTAPDGRLFYATVDGKGAGCVGIRPLAEGVCELKRLYVEPGFRGLGVGRDLALAAIRAARQIGYRKILLDTLPAMRIAVKLYRELGFTRRRPTTRRRWRARSSSPSTSRTGPRTRSTTGPCTTCSTSTAPGRTRCAKSIRAISRSSRTCRRPSTALDRLLGFAGTGQPDRRPAAGRGLRPSQCRQRRGAYRPQLPVGDPVRRRRAQGQAHHGRRPLRLRRRQGRARTSRVGLADIWLRHVQDVRAKHLRKIDDPAAGGAPRPPVRTQRAGTGRQRLRRPMSCRMPGSAASR
jgi:GNAT superfamily N-acetyltransferase